jgi:hypothetical protein
MNTNSITLAAAVMVAFFVGLTAGTSHTQAEGTVVAVAQDAQATVYFPAQYVNQGTGPVEDWPTY